MAPRRVAPSANTLSPLDTSSPVGQNQALHTFPRSNSPSGFTQFLAKPKQWFTRSATTPRLSNAGPEPKSHVNSRKHKISRPQDPRPFVESLTAGPYMGAGSKSVVDISSTRTPNSLDRSAFPSPSPPSAPSSPRGPGDLQSISTKAWSRSVDDLGKIPASKLSPIKTTFQEKVAQYRERSNSAASSRSPAPSTPSPVNTRHPWPNVSQSSPLTSSPPLVHHSPSGPSISVSAPDVEGVPSQNAIHMQQQAVHNRSHSFTPRLPSKLSNPNFGPTSPPRKGSAPTEQLERDINALKDRGPSVPNKQTTPARGPFPFGFASQVQKPLPPISNPAP
jgi:hypothetical protein